MTWLAPSVVATLMGTALLAFVFFYLYAQDRKKYLAVWAVSWTVYLLRYCFMMWIIFGAKNNLLLMGNQVTSLISGMLLLWGTYLFMGKKFPKIHLYLCSAGVLWIIASISLKFSFFVMAFPTFTFLAIVYILTGAQFVKSRDIQGPELKVTGWLFIVWGLHKANYPFMRPVEWFAAYGYLISATLEFAVALGMIMVYFRKARSDLHNSEKHHREMIANISDVIFIMDPTGRIEFASPNLEKWFGWSSQGIIGTHGLERVHPDDRQQVQSEFMKIMEDRLKVHPMECRYMCKDGSHKPIEVIATDLSHHPTIQGVLMNFRDISDRKQTEAALKWELKLNIAKADISRELMSQDYDIKKVSDITLKYALELTKSSHGFVSSIDPKTRDNLGHTLTDMFGDQCRVANQMARFPIGPDGKYPTLWGCALNDKKSFFTNHPHRHPGSTGLPQGHIALNSFLGVPVLMGETQMGLIALANSDQEYTEADIQSIERLSEIYALALHRQQYELDKSNMEKQLQQIHKLEAIGTLAGGIAHDFNNLLFPIVGMAELLLEDLDPESPEHEYALEIFTAGKRGSDLVKQILAFSRQAEQEKKPVRIQDVLEEAIRLSRSTIPANVEIMRDIQKDCGWVMADPSQIHQIALNLITNACHAVEENNGAIAVSLKETKLASEDLWNQILAPGRYAVLTVCDNGTGIEPGVMEKIFEPYFTTKKQGKGTGLGLALVHGIVKEHKGDIRVYSEVGKGTTVGIYLPLIYSKSETGHKDTPDKLETGSEHILLVDDEVAVTRLEQQVLQRMGYQITAFNSSVKALDAFQAQPNAFDLVISDMSMPHMTGEQLARAMREIRPDIPIIICTGFSERMNQKKAEALGIKGLLMKPVVKSELAREIRKALNGND
ncbi:MAG: PAS domain S-box protein [Desulfatibacillum sp.]|nr:PAS domain S-box protein [Desulfatibacillum sp.]